MSVMNTKQAGQALAAFDEAELGRLLDRVDGVAAGVGESDHLRLGTLRLQQIRGKVRGIQRRAHAAEHLAAHGIDDRGGLSLEIVAERIVGGDEKPGVAAGRDDGAAGAVGERVSCRTSNAPYSGYNGRR